MWPERSASSSRRSGRRLRQSGDGSRYAGGSGFRLFNATETKETPGQAATPNRGRWNDYEGRRITSRDSLAGVE